MRVGVERVGAVGVEDGEQGVGDVLEVAGGELGGLLGEERGDLAALLVLQVRRDAAQGAHRHVEVFAGDPPCGERLPQLAQLPAGCDGAGGRHVAARPGLPVPQPQPLRGRLRPHIGGHLALVDRGQQPQVGRLRGAAHPDHLVERVDQRRAAQHRRVGVDHLADGGPGGRPARTPPQ